MLQAKHEECPVFGHRKRRITLSVISPKRHCKWQSCSAAYLCIANIVSRCGHCSCENTCCAKARQLVIKPKHVKLDRFFYPSYIGWNGKDASAFSREVQQKAVTAGHLRCRYSTDKSVQQCALMAGENLLHFV